MLQIYSLSLSDKRDLILGAVRQEYGVLHSIRLSPTCGTI